MPWFPSQIYYEIRKTGRGTGLPTEQLRAAKRAAGYVMSARIHGKCQDWYAGMEVRESKAERINSRVRRLAKDKQVPVTREGEEKMNQSY